MRWRRARIVIALSIGIAVVWMLVFFPHVSRGDAGIFLSWLLIIVGLDLFALSAVRREAAAAEPEQLPGAPAPEPMWDPLREAFDQLEREVADRECVRVPAMKVRLPCSHGHVVPQHVPFDCSRLHRVCLHCSAVLD